MEKGRTLITREEKNEIRPRLEPEREREGKKGKERRERERERERERDRGEGWRRAGLERDGAFGRGGEKATTAAAAPPTPPSRWKGCRVRNERPTEEEGDREREREKVRNWSIKG